MCHIFPILYHNIYRKIKKEGFAMCKKILCMLLVMAVSIGNFGIKAKAVVDHSFGTEYDFHYIVRDGFYYSVSTNSEITGNEIKITGENAKKIKTIGRLEASNEDSFFYGNLRSAVTLDLTECTNLETINDFVGYGKTKYITIIAPTSLKRVGKNVLNIGGRIETTNINLDVDVSCRPSLIHCDKCFYTVDFDLNDDEFDHASNADYWSNKSWNVFINEDDRENYNEQSKLDNLPKRTFHTFDGFYYGDTQIFDKDGKQVQVPPLQNKKITLTAHWTVGKVKVKLINENKSANVDINYGTILNKSDFTDTVTNTINDWEGNRYTFTNWSYRYKETDDWKELTSPFTLHGNIELKANFKDNAYTVNFMKEDNKTSDTALTVTKIHSHKKFNGESVAGEVIDFLAVSKQDDINKKGYNLNGWKTVPSKKDADYNYDDNTIKDIGEAGDIVNLYPVRTPIQYTVMFATVDNRDEGYIPSIEAEYESSIKLPNCDFVREGYTFLGWSTKIVNPDDSSIEDVMYADGQSVINLTTEDKGIVTLYPVWSGNTYEIYYDTDDGEIIDKDYPTQYKCGTEVKLPEEVKKEGYIFSGWRTQYGDVVNKIDSEQIGDITLTAIWDKEEPKEEKIKSITKSGVKYLLSKKSLIVEKVDNKQNITIASSVKINGKTYKVTSIAKNAFKKAGKIKKLIIKVKYIKTVQKKAFSGMGKKAIIKLTGTKKKKKSVKKLIIASGFPKKRIKL